MTKSKIYDRIVDKLIDKNLINSYDKAKWSIDTEALNAEEVITLLNIINKITKKYRLVAVPPYENLTRYKILDIEL